MRPHSRFAIALCVAFCIAPLAHAEFPSVARARYGAEQGLAKGTVFFLESAEGAVAVGAGHSFELRKLAASPEIVFELGRTRALVAAANRVLAGPGAAFSEPGGSLRSDIAVFALDAPPAGVRVLRAGDAKDGLRVDVLGIPGSLHIEQEAIAGRVVEASDDELHVELDEAYDVRGWGGAPIVARDGGGVVGIVQGAQPSGKKLRVVATPIGAVTEALRFASEGGRGRAFAALAPEVAPIEGPKRSAPALPAEPPLIRQTGPPQPVALTVEHPLDGAIFGGEASAFIAGRALVPQAPAAGAGAFTTDVVFVLDTSGSSSAPSGADVNGNGIVAAPPQSSATGLFGLDTTDAGDSVLAAEVAAVRRLVTRLDPRYTRVGLTTFAGELLDYGVLAEDPARTEVALTTNYDDLQRALDRVLARGPSGATYMSAGVDQATRELLGARGAFSRADAASTKVVIFLTDGVPTLPFPSDDARNTEAVMHAASRANKAKVRVFPFGIGEEALSGPLALVHLARVTGGRFTPVRDPARLSEIFAQVEFADIESVAVRNATLGADAQATEVGADGSFGAFVALRAGRNEIEVTARATDGRSETRRLTVHYAPDAPASPVPPELLSRRNRLLEDRLTAMRRARISIEQQQADRVRQELVVEIERERARAEERATEQRKELDVRIDDTPAPKP